MISAAENIFGRPSHGQSLYDILAEVEESEYERRTRDIEYEAIPGIANVDGHAMRNLEIECEDASNNPVANDGSFISTLDRKGG